MRFRIVLFLLVIAVLLAGCIAPQAESSVIVSVQPSAQPTPSPTPAPLTLTVQAVADPSLLAADVSNPYSEINPYTLQIYQPDETLYNALYRAVEALEPTFDASGFDLTYAEKYKTGSCLFGESGFRFYYLKNFKLSEDGGTFTFIYTDTSDLALNEETFCARLGQLLYNTAPENGTDIQRFLAVYEYLCETASYSSDMSDQTTFSPYSILTNGEGICNGYASLLKYTLDHLGIPAEFVSNDPHAWNIVQLDGEWYQTDLTWGAGGPGETLNNTFTLLMDDETRIQSLTDAGWNMGDIHLGYPGADMGPMPACTSTRFLDYRGVGYVYAFDIADNRVYYNGDTGISRMNLDCTEQQTLLKGIYAYQMVFFDGILYYADMDTGFLYRLVPGSAPELLDDSLMVAYLALDGTSLCYGQTTPSEKTMLLLPFDTADYETADTEVLPAAQFPRSRTFRVDIQFSAPVDATQDWNQLVYLADAEGNPVRLHFSLSADGQTLTVRPAESIADAGTVTLCITEGITSEEGATLSTSCRMDISLVSSVQE